MKINVQNKSSFNRIIVAVDYKSFIPGESYREQMARQNNFDVRFAMGYVKPYIPQWYKNIMAKKRNQTVAVKANEFVKEMN
jgi:hypothetical protein